MQRYFQVSPPTVQQMLLNLHRAGLIQRVHAEPGSIKILPEPEDLPVLR